MLRSIYERNYGFFVIQCRTIQLTHPFRLYSGLHVNISLMTFWERVVRWPHHENMPV